MFSKTDKRNVSSRAQPPGKQSMPSILSSDLSIKGDVTSEGDIQIEGTVKGDIKSRNLTVGETGKVFGTVIAESVQVSGSVTGRIEARTVSLANSARVLGDIAHENLAIVSGASLEGQVSRLDRREETGALRDEAAKPGGKQDKSAPAEAKKTSVPAKSSADGGAHPEKTAAR